MRVYANIFGYRFAFNGKESDDEVSGSGNSYDYGFRIYNPRLGRFLSVDPLTDEYPWNSPYAYAENDVIRSIDVEGLEKAIIHYTRKNRKSKLTFVNSRDLETPGPLGHGFLAIVRIRKMRSKKLYDKENDRLYKGKIKITQFYYTELNEPAYYDAEVVGVQWEETQFIQKQEVTGFRKGWHLLWNRSPEPYGGPSRKVRKATGSERLVHKIMEGKPRKFLDALYSKAGEGSPNTVEFESEGLGGNSNGIETPNNGADIQDPPQHLPDTIIKNGSLHYGQSDTSTGPSGSTPLSGPHSPFSEEESNELINKYSK